MPAAPTALLATWLDRRADDSGRDWLSRTIGRLRHGQSQRDFEIAFALAPRRLGKADLGLSEGELAEAAAVRPGWDPRRWTIDEAARILLLLSFRPDEGFAARFSELCRSAEVGEAVALYRGLPLYPEPQALEAQAAEGVRSNMRAVFEAVAHNSPYPSEIFDEDRWNQMVLKALFIGSRLAPIQGLDARANAELAGILCDYAHERWAAGRPVSPELWRCVGPFAQGPMVDDLARAAGSELAEERTAAARALAAAPDPRAMEILAGLPQTIAAKDGLAELEPARSEAGD